MVTDPQTHTHTNARTGPITIHCAAKLSANIKIAENSTLVTSTTSCHNQGAFSNVDEHLIARDSRKSHQKLFTRIYIVSYVLVIVDVVVLVLSSSSSNSSSSSGRSGRK